MEDNTLLIVNIFLIGLCLSAIVVIVILIIQNSNISEEISEKVHINNWRNASRSDFNQIQNQIKNLTSQIENLSKKIDHIKKYK